MYVCTLLFVVCVRVSTRDLNDIFDKMRNHEGSCVSTKLSLSLCRSFSFLSLSLSSFNDFLFHSSTQHRLHTLVICTYVHTYVCMYEQENTHTDIQLLLKYGYSIFKVEHLYYRYFIFDKILSAMISINTKITLNYYFVFELYV